MASKKNDLTLEGQRSSSARPEVTERIERHMSQFKPPYAVIKGFLFVDDAWIASRAEGVHYQRETDPAIIEHAKKTWVDRGVEDSIGTMYSPCDERPHCVIAPYT